jgi:hypothetical protein
MAFSIRNAVFGVQAIAGLSSTATQPLGAIVNASDPDYGEGEFIYLSGIGSTVRGSVVTYNPDDFSTTLLNGREQVSSGDNRSVEFDQYPSELLNSVVVYKTPDPTLVAQGISGTVDLQTVRPLAIGKRGVNIKLAEELTGYNIDVYRDTEGEMDEYDIDLDEFTDEIEPWVIDELKRIGCDTARSVLDLSVDELERRTDLEKETIDEVRKVLQAEFEKG